MIVVKQAQRIHTTKQKISKWRNDDCMEWIGFLGPEFQQFKSQMIDNEIDSRKILSMTDNWNKIKVAESSTPDTST